MADWYPEVTVATIVERDGRFLVVEEDIDGQLVYNQPAGHLEEGETLLQAAIRETREETAWDVEIQATVGLYLYRSPRRGTSILRTTFIAKAIRHHSEQSLDDGILRTCWMTRAEIEATGRTRSPYVLRCIDDYLSGKRLPLDTVAYLGF